MNIFAGTSGWSYEQWVDAIYPHGLRPSQYLKYYSTRYNAVEIDSTFYRIPDDKTILKWIKSTGGNFKFCPKMFRKVTHDMKLENTGEVIDNFIKNISSLGKNLGIILIQMPPTLKFKNIRLIKDFIGYLPHGFKFTFEFRDNSWFKDEISSILRDYGIGIAWADTPFINKHYELTSNFLYLRLVGDRTIQESNFGRTLIFRDVQIEEWVKKIEEVSGRIESAFIFANNHYEGYAPRTIDLLMTKLGISNHDLIDRKNHEDYQGKLF